MTTASARLPRSLAGRASRLLAAVVVLAAVARADELTWSFSGTVSSIQPLLDPDTQLAMGTLDVHVGDPATALLVIETSAVGQPVSGPWYDFVQYDMAVADIQLAAGEWEAHFAPPAGSEATNFVSVADDQEASVAFDSWTATALGVDTQATLAASPYEDPEGAFGTLSFQFTAVPPKASTNTGLVQELSAYKTLRTVSFTGMGGAITILLAKPAASLSQDPVAIARHGELKAAAKMASTVSKVLAAVAEGKKESIDQALALAAAGDTFAAAASAALLKAQTKTGITPPGWGSVDTLKDALLEGCVTQAAPVTAGEDMSNAADRVLRGKLLRAMGRKLRVDFLAQAKNALKPAADKLVAAQEASKAKLLKAFEKALAAAAAQGVVYTGPDAETVADGLFEFVHEFTGMTATDL